jgi:uncharacterized LabA/DUF88 family protein
MKDLQVYANGLKKADWDVGMAVDAIRLAPSVDSIILATGDGDFVPLIEYLKSLGKIVEVISFGHNTSAKIKEVADDFIDLEKKLSKISYKKSINKKIKIEISKIIWELSKIKIQKNNLN